MHVLAAFFIVVSLVAGYYPLTSPPEKELRLVTCPDAGIVEFPVAETTVRLPVEPADQIQQRHLVKQKYDYSCGSAALATILKYQVGEPFTETQVIHGLLRYGDKEKIAERRAFSLLDMKKFIDVLGYQSVGYRANIEDLKDLNMPCIIPIELFEYRHFTVFKGVYKNHVFIADPFRGISSYPANQFEEMWHQNVIFVVYPKGKEQLSLLKLRTEDLRLIEEDWLEDLMFNLGPMLEPRPPEPFPTQGQIKGY
jgi:uncharacterized protein